MLAQHLSHGGTSYEFHLIDEGLVSVIDQVNSTVKVMVSTPLRYPANLLQLLYHIYKGIPKLRITNVAIQKVTYIIFG